MHKAQFLSYRYDSKYFRNVLKKIFHKGNNIFASPHFLYNLYYYWGRIQVLFVGASAWYRNFHKSSSISQSIVKKMRTVKIFFLFWENIFKTFSTHFVSYSYDKYCDLCMDKHVGMVCRFRALKSTKPSVLEYSITNRALFEPTRRSIWSHAFTHVVTIILKILS